MEAKTKRILGIVNDYIIITLGLLSYTAGWVIFVLPNELVGGGVSGIGAIIQYATGIPVAYSFFVINLVLLLIALKVLGKGFGVKTVYAIVVASLFFRVLPLVIPESFIREIAIPNGKLLCALIGGCLSGLGIGMTFSKGGSTGGTDIIALMVTKYRNVPPGRIILLMDIFIVGSSIFLPSEDGFGVRIANIMYGYILVAACGFTVDLSVSGTKQSVQVFIFSKKYSEIADMITSTMHRGVTVLNGYGWFTKNDEKVLMVIIRKVESNQLLSMIKQIDRDAFLSVGSVMGVYGNGFDAIKTKNKKLKI
ncbi:MAG TPA: YitT family protein [Candidatus Coprenecus stercoripullorum]|nr:YitT family protein [Candidatus Coprenecus stercoripullorum]